MEVWIRSRKRMQLLRSESLRPNNWQKGLYARQINRSTVERNGMLDKDNNADVIYIPEIVMKIGKWAWLS